MKPENKTISEVPKSGCFKMKRKLIPIVVSGTRKYFNGGCNL